jgi:hypothetical protein
VGQRWIIEWGLIAAATIVFKEDFFMREIVTRRQTLYE